MINFKDYEVLSFDCYGTLIDWENGILATLRPVLSAHRIDLSDDRILELYAEMESRAEEDAYLRYGQMLRQVMRQLGDRLGFAPSASELDALADSLRNWKPFPDTVEALKTLKKRFRLAIISNIDDDLFACSAEHLKVEFDWIITAEQTESYKPSLHNFQLAIERIGVAPEKILHIAQSIYHDIIPAKRMGLTAVWVNRRKDRQGSGATPVMVGDPDLEVPDLKTLVTMVGANLR